MGKRTTLEDLIETGASSHAFPFLWISRDRISIEINKVGYVSSKKNVTFFSFAGGVGRTMKSGKPDESIA